MAANAERDLGEQPMAEVMKKHDLKSHDIVAASTEQITHKMVSRAVKGRRLTPAVQQKILNAVNKATAGSYSLKELFNY